MHPEIKVFDWFQFGNKTVTSLGGKSSYHKVKICTLMPEASISGRDTLLHPTKNCAMQLLILAWNACSWHQSTHVRFLCCHYFGGNWPPLPFAGLLLKLKPLYTIYHDDVIKWKHFPTLCVGNSSVTGEFPLQRPVTQSFDVFFDRRLNKRLSKQSRCCWFETPSRSLWRHCDDPIVLSNLMNPTISGWHSNIGSIWILFGIAFNFYFEKRGVILKRLRTLRPKHFFRA